MDGMIRFHLSGTENILVHIVTFKVQKSSRIQCNRIQNSGLNLYETLLR